MKGQEKRPDYVGVVLLLAVVAAIVVTTCNRAHAQVGSANVPTALPADIKDWLEFPSCHTMPPCVLELDNVLLEYNMYIDPRDAAVYAITHYRVRPTKVAGVLAGWARGYRGREAVVWLKRGKPNIFRVFIREARWPLLGLGKRWREWPAGSPEYAMEVAVANRIHSVRQLILHEDRIPRSIAF